MNDEILQKDKKQILKEKKELKMLERFQYEDKEKSLRESTRKIIHQQNFYTSLIKGIPGKIDEQKDSSQITNGKKRGRKPKRLKIKSSQTIPKTKTNTKPKDPSKKVSNKSSKHDLGNYLKETKFDCEAEQHFNEELNGHLNSEKYSPSNITNENIKNISEINEEIFDFKREDSEISSEMSNNEKENSNFTESFSNINHKSSNSVEISNRSFLKNHINLKNKNYENNYSNQKKGSFQNKPDNSENGENEETIKIRNKLRNEYQLELQKYRNIENINKHKETDTTMTSKTYINCDLRFFNYELITSRIGFFDVIMLDPPWRIKGGQRNDSSFMFSNSKFNLEYNTMSNNEIISIPVEKLSKKGFCFLWVLNSLMNVGYECLNKWGYDVVDQITWVKTRNEKLYISQGYYFLHSSETCLVGYKCPPNERVEYKSKIASNIMFGNVRGKSQKPEEIYQIVEKMMPGAKKVELFARNNNLREGWLSLGNQLGENFQAWKNIIHCDNCNSKIEIGIKRYKSKLIANYDICQKCFEKTFIFNSNANIVDQDTTLLNGHKKNNFFEFKNNINEDVLHNYYSCNDCHTEPIWGNRFQCLECENFDLCEACFDKEISNESKSENPHVLMHEFKCQEMVELANGLSAHNDYRCKFCFQKPIIGPCFECMECKNYTVCQNCYFNSCFVDDKHFNINSDHKFTIHIKTKNKLSKYVKCNGCSKEPIEKIRFKCNNCFDFNLCEVCYRERETKEFLATSHKNYHSFTAFCL